MQDIIIHPNPNPLGNNRRKIVCCRFCGQRMDGIYAQNIRFFCEECGIPEDYSDIKPIKWTLTLVK